MIVRGNFFPGDSQLTVIRPAHIFIELSHFVSEASLISASIAGESKKSRQQAQTVSQVDTSKPLHQTTTNDALNFTG